MSNLRQWTTGKRQMNKCREDWKSIRTASEPASVHNGDMPGPRA